MGKGHMSRDRIKFTVPYCRLLDQQYLKLLKDCFGISDAEMANRSYHGLEIICRPSQFGRFCVERNNRGIQNMMAELDPQFIPEPKPRPPQPLEVWDRENRLHGC